MRNLFNPDNPFMRFLSRVGEMIMVNFFFLICSVPIVTCGASLAALHKVTQNIALDGDKGVVKTFFLAFRDNFKQATVVWLLVLLFFAGMVCNWLLMTAYTTGVALFVCKCIVGVLSVLVLSLCAYIFPLIARYENTLKEHFVNAGVLMIVKLPRTLAMVLLNALPAIIAYFSLPLFFKMLIFWLLLGFAFASYIASTLLTPVFRELENPDGPNVGLMN